MAAEAESVKMKQVVSDDFTGQALNENIWRIRTMGKGDYVSAITDEDGGYCLEVSTNPGKHGSVAGAVLNRPAFNCDYRLEFEFQWVGAVEKASDAGESVGPKEMKDILSP